MTWDIGILALRMLFGAAIAAHGAQKLFGWFGGYGLKGTAGFFETIGFKPGMPYAAAAGLTEFGGGILLLLGLFTPAAAAAVFSTMLVAMISVHIRSGFFAATNGIEVAFLYAAAALGTAFTGAGTFSLDALFALSWMSQPIIIAGLLLAGILGAFVTLALRRQGGSHELSHEPSRA